MKKANMPTITGTPGPVAAMKKMAMSDLKKFAGTPTKGLPTHKGKC